MAVAAVFLFTFTSTRLPLDQDLGSKAAKVENLSRLAPFASPTRPPLYYREAYFSFYYQVEALFHRLLGGTAIADMGASAAFCGVIFFGALAAFLERLAGIGPWWSLFLFLNTPALVVNFLYGNEASLSMALVALAAALLAWRAGPSREFAAGILLGLAFFCRPDVVFLAPFFLLLLAHDGFAWRRVLSVGLSAALTALLYWLLAVRALPSETAFPWIIDWRIFAVYLFFGFGPLVTMLALWGLFKQDRSRWLLPLSTLVPLLYYFRDLGSPKYILGLAFGTTLCAAWAIAASGRVFQLALVAVSLVFWFFSFTPFGVFGPSRGGHWVAPAGHGPVAFGSYLSFYEHIRDGFFGERYRALEQTWEIALNSFARDPRPLRVIGSSDDHMLNLVCEQRGVARSAVPVTIDLPGEFIRQLGRMAMLFNGYTRLSYLTAPGAETLVRQWLAAGLVAPLAGDERPQALPYIVEIGPTVAHPSPELGARILWADSYAHSSGLAPLQYFTADYAAFCFVPAAGAFTPTTRCPPGVTLWGNWWPAVYYRNHADRARAALTKP